MRHDEIPWTDFGSGDPHRSLYARSTEVRENMDIKGPFKTNISLMEEGGFSHHIRNQTNFIIWFHIFFLNRSESKMQVAQLCPTLRHRGLEPHQAPLSLEFSGQGYWSELPFPFPKQKQNEAQLVAEKSSSWDFPAGPVVETVLPMQGTEVQSLVRELTSHMPQYVAKKVLKK